MSTTSISLIQRLQEPSAPEADWERFVALYSPMLRYWGQNRLSLSESEADDLVQEVMLLLIDKLKQFEPLHPGGFRGWLKTVAHRKGVDYLRGKSRDAAPATSGQLRELAAGDDVLFLSEEEYRSCLAQRALKLMRCEFQETTWKACWMLVVEGLSGREVAGRLEISENAAYLARARVLKRLRKELDGLWED